MEKQKNAVGRRKEAVTRVFISKGNGKIKPASDDFDNNSSRMIDCIQIERYKKNLSFSAPWVVHSDQPLLNCLKHLPPGSHLEHGQKHVNK